MVSAQTQWQATSTHGFPLQSTVAASPLAANTPLHVVVSLRLQNADALATFLHNQQTPGNPQYGVVMTPEQFVAAYSPSTAQVTAVVDYLTSQGFSNVTVTPDRLLISADTTAGAAETAFNTSLVQFPVGNRTAFAPTSDVMVPSSLGGIVLAVSGLENLSAITRQAALRADTRLIAPDQVQRVLTPDAPAAPGTVDPNISTFSPAALRTAYDAGNTSTGAGTVVAVVSAGDDLSQVISDLRQAERDNGLPLVPVTVRQVVPVPNPPDTSGDAEWDLDSQSITGIAYNVKQLIFYNTASLGDSDLLAANDAFAQDNLAKIGNMSYGGCENLEEILGSLSAFDQLFAKAVAQGQTWSASSGDSGAACSILINLATPDFGVPSSVEYPASSPYVVAVGGTTLFTDSNFNYVTELAWDAGGGGISMFEKAPSWQAKDLAIPSSPAGLRAVPDVAMAAGPEGAAGVGVGGAADVVIGGAHAGVLGTSWSSPLNVGVWARLESARCNGLLFEAPAVYALDTTQQPESTATGFHDVILGNNGQYSATPGWDYTTGYGSFDISAVNGALPAADPSCVPPAKVTPPVARLTASPNVGLAPLAVNFNASGSSDPAGGTLTSYALDYGDTSAPSVQTNPMFPAHAYSVPGVYTAQLTVRNAGGAISSPATQPVTVLGTPAACSAGGDTVLTSPAGVSFGVEGQDIGNGTDDLRSTSISEPADMDGKLVFTMKVANLSSVPPGFRWVTYFDIAGRNEPNKEYYYVAMVSADGPAPVFNYGTHGFVPGAGATDYTVLGTLDAASSETADGTIKLVLDKAALGIKTGDRLLNILSSTRTSAPDDPSGTLPGGEGLTQDSAGAPAPYTVVGNATCAANAAPIPVLNAQPASGSAPLLVTLDGTASTAQSGQATVAFYRFDFGDGSGSGWQSSATVSHLYQAAGTYTASLEVADSRGLISQSSSSKTITVQTGGGGGGATPTASLTASPASGAPPLQVSFDASGSQAPNGASIQSYTFDFGDNSSPVTQSTPTVTHTYQKVGSYSASVTVTDSNGHTASASTTVMVQSAGSPSAPEASLTVTPASGQIPLTVSFDASGSHNPDGAKITQYRFDFNDGSAAVTQNTPTVSHTYPAAGTYHPSVVVQDSDGQVSGPAIVQVQATTTVVVTPGGPVAELTVSPTEGPAPLSVTFDGSKSYDPNGTITAYTFDFGDGSQPLTQPQPTASHTYTAPGRYVPSLTVADTQGKTARAEATVSVAPVGGGGGGSPSPSTPAGHGGGAFDWLTLLGLLGLGGVGRRRVEAESARRRPPRVQ